MKKYISLFVLLIIAIFIIVFQNQKNLISNTDIKSKINNYVFNNFFQKPKNLLIKGKNINFDFTIDQGLQNYLEKLLKSYKTPYAAVVVIDNNNGKILALAGINQKNKTTYPQLTLSSTNPGASLFKIVSSAALLNQQKISVEDKYSYNGKGTTLYKSQLIDKKNRWTRSITFKKSFAFSNNVIFGKLAIKYLTPNSLREMANNFGFNDSIVNILDISKSKFQLASSDYQLAEFGSGFNKINTISPLHAAYLSMIVARDGLRQNLSIIDYLDIDGKEINLEDRNLNDFTVERVILPSTAKSIQEMMIETVNKGTARGIKNILRRNIKNKLKIGAKTGSITGGFPFGKREWVTAFAIPMDMQKGKGISLAVLNILENRWYVRSSHIAKKVIEYYFSNKVKLN